MRIFTFFTLLLFSEHLLACSCAGDSSLEAAFGKHKNIVIVRVVSTEPGTEPRQCMDLRTDKWRECNEEFIAAKVAIVEIIKGNVGGEITVIGKPENYGCHKLLEAGEEVILFLNDSLKTSFNSCSVNRAVRSIDKAVLDDWRKQNDSNK